LETGQRKDWITFCTERRGKKALERERKKKGTEEKKKRTFVCRKCQGKGRSSIKSIIERGHEGDLN